MHRLGAGLAGSALPRYVPAPANPAGMPTKPAGMPTNPAGVPAAQPLLRSLRRAGSEGRTARPLAIPPGSASSSLWRHSSITGFGPTAAARPPARPAAHALLEYLPRLREL